MRYTTAHRIGKRGPVVFGFVAHHMKRRTVAVTFRDSDEVTANALIDYIDEHIDQRPAVLDDGRK